MRSKRVPLLILASLLVFSCSRSSEREEPQRPYALASAIQVGFSQMNHINPWRVAETNDFRRAAPLYGVELILKDAESSQSKQIEHIKELVERGVDYIICTPIIAQGWEEAFRLCREAGIPLIMLDREVEGIPGEDFLTFVGSNFVEEAERAAQWLADHTGSSAKIVELRGREGASCVIDRAAGFRTIIDGIPDMYIVTYEYADFERIKGQRVMEEIILTYGKDFDAVYAHNDEMAIGAIQALKAADLTPGTDVLVVSIDGSKDALKSILAGTLGATVECTPYLADETLQAIQAHARGEEIPHKILVKDRMFTYENAEQYIEEAF